MFIRSAILCFLLLSAIQAQTADVVDVELRKTFEAVTHAAANKDYDVLENLMVENFKYSFGGSSSRSEALTWYRKYPELLDRLVEVLARECVLTDVYGNTRLVCPAEAIDLDHPYNEYRAAFVRSEDGSWSFEWFVAGD